MKKFVLTGCLLALSLSAQAFDLKQLGQQAIGQSIQGAIEGKSGKEILKDSEAQTKQQVQQEAADMAKNAPNADSNPLGAIATDVAAQKAAQKAGGTNGQLASDLVKGASGALQNKMTGSQAPTPEAAPIVTEASKMPASSAAPTAKAATSKTTKTKKKATPKKTK